MGASRATPIRRSPLSPEPDLRTKASTPAGPRVLAREHAVGDDRPFAQCHAPTLVADPDGRVLAAWFGGTREGHDDVAIWAAERSATPGTGAAKATAGAKVTAGTKATAGAKLTGDAVATDADGGPAKTSPTDVDARTHAAPGEGWSRPRVIARVEDAPHWNPVLFALDDAGRELVLHFKVGRSIRRWRTWHQRSHDGGRTWCEATPLPVTEGAGLARRGHPGRFGRGAVRCKPIRLASGDWLAGASLERWRRWDVFFDRSPDGWRDWRATALVGIDRRRFEGKGLIQPTLWESSPGRVHALFRSTDGRVHRSDSDDDGRTWSPARATTLPNNNSGLDVARLPDGRLALACNPVAGNWAARTPISVLFSDDEGETWPERVDVETGPGELSYPALVVAPGAPGDGPGLALAYTWNRRRIAFAWIAPGAARIATGSPMLDR